MYKKAYRLLIIILFVHTAAAGLSSGATRSGKYVRIAMENRRDIQIAKEQEKLVNLRIVNAYRLLGPSVLLQYKDSEGETITDPYHSKSYNIKVSQSVFMGGKKYYTLKKELAQLEVAENETRKKEQEIKYEVLKAYYNALLNKEKLDSTMNLLTDSERDFMVSEKKYKAKIITELEYLEVEDLSSEILLQKKIQENELNLATLELKKACAIDFRVDISLLNDNMERDPNYLEQSIEKYKEMALKNRPEVKGLESLVLSTEFDHKVAKSERWPSLGVEGTVGKSGETYTDEDLILATEWAVIGEIQWVFWGSSLGGKLTKRRAEPSEILDNSIRFKGEERFAQLSVLDRLDYYFRAQEKKIGQIQAQKDVEDIRKKVVFEVEKSYDTLMTAFDMIELAEDKLELNEKKVNIIEKKHFLGEATTKELIDAKMKYMQQRNALYEAMAKYNIALAELKISAGIDVYPMSTNIVKPEEMKDETEGME